MELDEELGMEKIARNDKRKSQPLHYDGNIGKDFHYQEIKKQENSLT
jgi:hypothetical protein